MKMKEAIKTCNNCNEKAVLIKHKLPLCVKHYKVPVYLDNTTGMWWVHVDIEAGILDIVPTYAEGVSIWEFWNNK